MHEILFGIYKICIFWQYGRSTIKSAIPFGEYISRFKKERRHKEYEKSILRHQSEHGGLSEVWWIYLRV